MTTSRRAIFSTVIARLDRAIQYSRDVEINRRSRGVLDTPWVHDTSATPAGVLWNSEVPQHTQSSYAGLTRVSINLRKEHFWEQMDCRIKLGNDSGSTRRLEPLFGQQPHRGVGVHRLAQGKPLRVFAAQLIKLDRIPIGLSAFGDHPHAEVVRPPDD